MGRFKVVQYMQNCGGKKANSGAIDGVARKTKLLSVVLEGHGAARWSSEGF